jgi:flagellar FliJ protein
VKSTFHFPLERLLSLRERRENDVSKALGAARNAETELRTTRALTARERDAARSALLPAPGTHTDVASLRNNAILVERLDQRLRAIDDGIAKAEAESTRLHAALLVCVRDRRVLERLRERRHAEWRVEVDRREREVMDAARSRPASDITDTPRTA